MKECYMCHSEAVSQEHVPPICIFPESKDLPSGINYRKNLITVPSCAEHNLSKSGDDEYLLFLLVANIDVNSAGLQQWATKVKRSINYKPTKLGIYRNLRPVSYAGIKTGIFDLDNVRIYSELEKISRGIYYNHFQKHWPYEIDVVLPLAIATGSTESDEYNLFAREIATSASKFLESETKFGENPDIFYYQYKVEEDVQRFILRMIFYGGIEVVSRSSPELTMAS